MNLRGQNRQLAINMIAQLVSFAVNFGISFVLTPYIVKTIGKEAYGFVGLANNFVSYATILTTALNSMAGRFITIFIHRDDFENANKYMSSVFWANVLVSLILVVPTVYCLISMSSLIQIPNKLLGDVTILWTCLFANFLIGNITSVFSVSTFVSNRLDIQSVTGIISNIVRAAFLVAVYYIFDAKVWYMGASTILCSILGISVNVYCTKKMLPSIHIQRKQFDFSCIRHLIASGIWNSVTKISSILSNGLDLLITNIFISTAAMGSISLAKNLPTYILSFLGSVSAVFAPQLTISYAKNNYDDIKRQLKSAINILGFISCIPITVMYAYGDIFFSLWVPGQDAQLLQLLGVISSLAFPFVLPLEPLWNIFTITDKVKQSSIFLIINSILTIVIVFIFLNFARSDFVKMLIIVGISTIFSIIRALFFLPIYGAKCLHFKWSTFYPPVLKSFVVTIILTALSIGLRKIFVINSWLTLLIACFITAAISVVINYFILLNHDERSFLKRKIFKKKGNL